MPEYFTDEDKEWARLGRERQERVRKEYGTFFAEIARILYEHDFLGLATAGCPEDEYELEAGTIIPRLHETNSPGLSKKSLLGDTVSSHSARTNGLRKSHRMSGPHGSDIPSNNTVLLQTSHDNVYDPH